ncbi:MAG: HAMP domain-containing sensor histidine kinase [Candidatus Sericytochromatia bacterium]
MLTKLYKKLYLYAIGIVILSIILTFIFLSIFGGGERRLIRGHVKNELIFARDVIFDKYQNQPEKIQDTLSNIGETLRWELAIWKDDKCIAYTDSIHNINEISRDKDLDELDIIEDKGIFLVYFNDEEKAKGFITIRFKPPPHKGKGPHIHFDRMVPPLMALVFLAILMIPFTKYIVKPFKKLMISINEVSLGNFSNKIETNGNSEFAFIEEAFNNMTEKINNMIINKERLIADVSHELRTPLTKIRLCLEILGQDENVKRKYIDKSIVEIENLDQLIDNLLVSSKLEIDKDNSKAEKINLRDFINTYINKNQILLNNKGLKIQTSFYNEELNVLFDPKLFERVFNNIFSNTIKYAPDNSDLIISTDKEDNKNIIKIRDHGIGVKKEQLGKIFDPFYRTDESRDRKTGGTGLGLSIVKKIIENNKGQILAELPNDGKNGLIIKIILNSFS